MEYVLLSDVGSFSDERISIEQVTVDNYVSTENMVPNKGGVIQASSLPDAKKVSKYNPGDILLSNIRPYFKKIWFANCTGGCSNDVLVVHPKNGIDAKFLYYVLSDSNFFNYDTLTAKGTKMPRGTKHAILKYWVPNLPLQTQQRIASILSAYDSQIENNQKRIKLLEQMAENLYKEWFVRFRFPGYENAEFEGGVPKGWKIVKLNSVANIVYGFPFNSSCFCSESSLNPVVRIRDIADKHTETYTPEKPDDKYLIHTNDILIGMDGIFHMNIWTNEGDYLNQRVVKVSSKMQNLSNQFLFYSLFPQVKMLESIISGTTVAHLSAKDMNKMTVLIPSDDVLRLCFSKFENIMSMRRTLLVQNDLLTHQRDLLLPRLMSGKLSI